ncbi:ADPRase [Cryptophlebia peltastica nucleopolyhedrovirus]|uniref:ADPRase n=1 Tax=Cryptophlebia peltastica nucleopolyhedrovirus TaxID=2304025 RepID=A0A346RNP7_9ABAC|nr:ADPRase [Cryptophlebia peltastica nucleopolyhedrovirus]AXS67694.1 ADPRase [Cryptophlebia peltastica nucleopolyhedrovirus]
MKCAGLFMIMDHNRAVLLRARRAYNAAFNTNNAITFLEKISIPRGKRDGQDIFDYETAIREFIEETGTFFESAHVYKSPFVLQWNDCGVTYKYAIYIGILNGPLQSIPQEPNTFCVKLRLFRPNDYKINIETRRYNNEIQRNLYILPLDDYFQYMNEKQLFTYDSSNYLEFFDFVKTIKKKFDYGSLNEFFLLSLKLDIYQRQTPTCQQKRKKISALAKTELKNLMNLA